MPTTRRRRLLTSLITLGLVGAMAAAPNPATASDTQAWFKPGVPHSYSFADPSLTGFGPMTWAYSTNQGGADLPAMWSPDNQRYVARVEGSGSDAYIDDPAGYGNDAFPNVPWGVNFNSCTASDSGCDPKEMWAPSVGLVGTQWVSYHAVMVTKPGGSLPYGRFCIFVARATSPMGPFRSASSNPIVCPSSSTDPAGAIDPDVFVDEETGKAYLIWKTEGNTNGNRQKFYSRQLNSTGTGFASGSTNRMILENTAGTWESTVMENPSMTYINGAYILLYSGNRYNTKDYATGYAACSGPVGPCTKVTTSTPLMRSVTGAWGPGGADGFADQRGRFIAMYHAWTNSVPSQGRRVPHTAELSVTGTGRSARVSVIRRDINPGAEVDRLWSFDADYAFTAADKSVGGTYTPAAGDFNGDGNGDIYWYGLWDKADALWSGTNTRGTFTSTAPNQAGAFVPVPGDYNGDGRSDLFWYQPGVDPRVRSSALSGATNYEPNARADELWLATSGGGWTQSDRGVTGAAIPLPGDFDGDGDTDIIWFAPGEGADTMWKFQNGTPTSVALNIVGNYRPVVGDFDGNGTDDIFWYGPGAKSDYIWWYSTSGTYTSVPTTVTKKDYRPFAGDFDGDGADELFWYTPGSGPDYIWSAITRAGQPTSRTTSAGTVATPVVGDFDDNGYDDVFWYR